MRKFQYFSSWNNYGFVPSAKCREKVKIIDILMNILGHVFKNNALKLNTLNGSQYGLCLYINKGHSAILLKYDELITNR